ncbi:uncharacterized protein LOC112592705, partial [Melanaphis sacchari]|uniref:uncharacterized protein LOC112592705 n=1 Tax=Melanaphis sacchari TaxID=742174 RepID=UPI000DC13484
MNSFILLMTFVLQLQWINSNANTTSKLGISPCMYSGSYDEGGYTCSSSFMAITSLPPECTSFVFDISHYVNYLNESGSSFEMLRVLGLSESLKPLYLYIGYDDPESWINAAKNAKDTATKVSDLKSYLYDANITGLILKDLNSDP